MIEFLITGAIIIVSILILVKQFKKKLKGDCGSCSGNCSCCTSNKPNHSKKNTDK